MRQMGSEAIDWGYVEEYGNAAAPAREPRPSFEVVTGGGLDARVRQGISPAFLGKVKAVAAAAALLLALGGARVALTVATVSQLQAKSDLKAQVTEAQTLSDELKVERSVLSSNSRISRIATQNLGMVLSSSRVDVDVNAAVEAGDEGTDDAATDTATDEATADEAAAEDATDAADEDAAATDGDAAQTADAQGQDASHD